MPYRCSHGGLLDLCLDVSCSMFRFLFIKSLSHKPPVSCYSAKLGFPAINIYLIQIPCVFPKYLNWCSLLHACLKFNTDDCQRMTNPSMWVCVECCLMLVGGENLWKERCLCENIWYHDNSEKHWMVDSKSVWLHLVVKFCSHRF